MSGGGWKKPDSVAHPSVWRRCEGRKLVDGRTLSFVIQDVPADREEDVVDFMARHYIGTEPLVMSTHMSEDTVSVEEMRQAWRGMLQQKVSLVAFLEGDGPRLRIAGANMLGVVSRGDNIFSHQYQGEALTKIVTVKKRLYSLAPDPFQKYAVHEYLSALGMCVAEEFRGHGLGSQLLEARRDLAQAVGLHLSVTSFSSVEAQVLAIKDGWQELSRVSFVDFEVAGEPLFPGVASPGAILMAKRLQ